jgi:hypothetical protein
VGLPALSEAVVFPPSKVNTSPVMYEESMFEAKQAYAGVTSSRSTCSSVSSSIDSTGF